MLHLGGKILTMTDGVVSLLNRASATHALLECVALEGDENVSVIGNDECRC